MIKQRLNNTLPDELKEFLDDENPDPKTLARTLLDKVEELVQSMEVPVYHRRNPSWIAKNLNKRNGKHPNFEKVSKLVRELIARGIGHG